MCYVCTGSPVEDAGRRSTTAGALAISGDGSARRLVQRTVLVARDWTAARHFCRDYRVNLQDPFLIVIVSGDPRAENRLRGISNFTVVRADGARATEWVERYLTYLAQRQEDLRVNIQLNPRDFLDTTDAALRMLRSIPEAQVEAAGVRETRRREMGLQMTRPYLGSDTGLVNPHHWASTLQRSPYWNVQEKILRVPTMDMTVLEYRPEELEEDIRYV